MPVKTSHSILAASSLGFAAVLALHATATPSRPVLASPPATAPTGTTPPSSSATRTATGATEQFGYGEVAVKVTVNGQQIVGVSIATLQTAESYSQSIAQQALPELTQEALSAQSANIQSVSGASYTSAGFAQSLQSALTQLGL
jgi:uncharacterized protein with FMN-binding domain